MEDLRSNIDMSQLPPASPIPSAPPTPRCFFNDLAFDTSKTLSLMSDTAARTASSGSTTFSHTALATSISSPHGIGTGRGAAPNQVLRGLSKFVEFARFAATLGGGSISEELEQTLHLLESVEGHGTEKLEVVKNLLTPGSLPFLKRTLKDILELILQPTKAEQWRDEPEVVTQDTDIAQVEDGAPEMRVGSDLKELFTGEDIDHSQVSQDTKLTEPATSNSPQKDDVQTKHAPLHDCGYHAKALSTEATKPNTKTTTTKITQGDVQGHTSIKSSLISNPVGAIMRQKPKIHQVTMSKPPSPASKSIPQNDRQPDTGALPSLDQAHSSATSALYSSSNSQVEPRMSPVSIVGPKIRRKKAPSLFRTDVRMGQRGDTPINRRPVTMNPPPKQPQHTTAALPQSLQAEDLEGEARALRAVAALQAKISNAANAPPKSRILHGDDVPADTGQSNDHGKRAPDAKRRKVLTEKGPAPTRGSKWMKKIGSQVKQDLPRGRNGKRRYDGEDDSGSKRPRI